MPKGPAQKAPIRWRPRPHPIAAAGAAAFLGLTGFLGLRVAAGEDPALAGRSAATAQVQSDTAPSGDTSSSDASTPDVTSDDTTSSADTASPDDTTAASGDTSSSDDTGQVTENPSTGTSGG